MSKGLPLVNPSLAGCRGCTALCCHDLWQAMAAPRSADEIADVKWRLHFEAVEIHVRGAEWLLRVKGRCRYLGDDNLCTIYDRRPRHCRDHRPPYCQRYVDHQPTVLARPEDVDAYFAGHAGPGTPAAPSTPAAPAPSAPSAAPAPSAPSAAPAAPAAPAPSAPSAAPAAPPVPAGPAGPARPGSDGA